MFEVILEQYLNNEGEWKGLGSVTLLRRDPRRAL